VTKYTDLYNEALSGIGIAVAGSCTVAALLLAGTIFWVRQMTRQQNGVQTGTLNLNFLFLHIGMLVAQFVIVYLYVF
jgi:Ca2+/Na+ antiporter